MEAYESINAKPLELKIQEKSRSLKQGIIVNLPNPHPYVFYFTLGVPLIITGLKNGLGQPLVFVICFLGSLVGTKIVLASIVSKFRGFLKSSAYIHTMKVLGIILLIFAVFLLKEGLDTLGIVSLQMIHLFINT